jgi:hypothetical protein
MTSLGVTTAGSLFEHLIYHFVLTYSNWETGTICFSESFESLSAGLQNALWELGGVPQAHQTDRMTLAVNQMPHPEEFTQRYRGLLDHYGLAGRAIQAGKANENGDVEKVITGLLHGEQALLRGSHDFARASTLPGGVGNATPVGGSERGRTGGQGQWRRRLDASLALQSGRGADVALKNTHWKQTPDGEEVNGGARGRNEVVRHGRWIDRRGCVEGKIGSTTGM